MMEIQLREHGHEEYIEEATELHFTIANVAKLCAGKYTALNYFVTLL